MPSQLIPPLPGDECSVPGCGRRYEFVVYVGRHIPGKATTDAPHPQYPRLCEEHRDTLDLGPAIRRLPLDHRGEVKVLYPFGGVFIDYWKAVWCDQYGVDPSQRFQPAICMELP